MQWVIHEALKNTAAVLPVISCGCVNSTIFSEAFSLLQKGKPCFANKERRNNALGPQILLEESSGINCCPTSVPSSLENWVRKAFSASGQMQLAVIPGELINSEKGDDGES